MSRKGPQLALQQRHQLLLLLRGCNSSYSNTNSNVNNSQSAATRHVGWNLRSYSFNAQQPQNKRDSLFSSTAPHLKRSSCSHNLSLGQSREGRKSSSTSRKTQLPMALPCIDRNLERERSLLGPEPSYTNNHTGYETFHHSSPFHLVHGGSLPAFDIA